MALKETIYDLLNRQAKIWVQNSTHPLGIVSLTLANGDPFPIPKTKDPICLSDVLSEKEIRESQQLRNALSKGLIKLVAQRAAEGYYEATGKAPEDAFKKQDDLIQMKVMNSPNLNDQEVAFSTETLNVSPSMVQLALSLSHPDIGDEEAVNIVASKFAEFTPEDLGYLMSHVHRASINEYLLRRQRELQAPSPVEIFTPPTEDGEAESHEDTSPTTKVMKRGKGKKSKAAAKPEESDSGI